ncbi:hypothetical protein [Evansella cellulosilytica]|uniref:Uncharacterized protein n=1 Tax=Evansella cellulosilytica (strain ATCC 21833 / DSM 2522 / FERM P-1141 / JCM 9156 / N-4) TaxID=649639 RepID=E6TVN7_EVAC2|nr:hypothetical protein [Evansella cellulosilytica]ADU32165.1 hypothetical protein Bcell_3930 [Evansella cellulosilytica DSM 2522]
MNIIGGIVFSILDFIEKLVDDTSKSIKLLIMLNIISYIHIFYLYYNVGSFIEGSHQIDGNFVSIVLLGGLLPYLLLFITSFVLSKRDAFLGFRREAILDWFLRLLAYILIFQQYSFDVLLANSNYILVTLVSFMLISFFLEYKMVQKSKRFVPNENAIKMEFNPTKEEINNIPNMEKAVSIGVGSIFVASGLAIGIAISIPSAASSLIRTIILFCMSISAFMWFLSISYSKCHLFYVDKKCARRNFIKDSSIAFFGYLLCILGGMGLLSKEELTIDIVIIAGVFSLLPAINTNRRMAIYLEKIKNV